MEHLTIEKALPPQRRGEYVLASGPAAVERLFVLHRIYAPAGRRLLLQAGLKPGMHVVDFGCGVGAVTQMLSEIVGPKGSVIGLDASQSQVEQATHVCNKAGRRNVWFAVGDACRTGLPRDAFDLVYCRFLLLHLTDPAACLREMLGVLKPGGILVVEDGDLASGGSIPPTALDAFAGLFMRLGSVRGLNYSVATDLYHLVKAAGFTDPQIEIHQPAGSRSDCGVLLARSVEEAGPALVGAGLITQAQLNSTVARMDTAAKNPDVLALAPRMSVVWARKAA